MYYEKLDEKEIKAYIKKDYVFKANTEKKVYRNYFLFLRSLYKNYEKTLKALISYEFDDLYFDEMDKNLSDYIHGELEERYFYIDKKNMNLLNYNPLFLLVSLENKYDSTIKNLASAKEEIHVPDFARENKMIEDLLIEEDFVLKKNNINLINCSGAFLMASLKNDYHQTMKTLKMVDFPIVNITREQGKRLIDILFKDNMEKLQDLPIIVANILIKYFCNNYSDLEETDRNFIRYLVKENFIPKTCFDSDTLCEDLELLKACCNSVDEYIYLNDKINSYNSFKYCAEDEKALIDILGKEYSNCECVEDVMKQLYLSCKSRDKMSLLEMFSLNLYGCKVLKNKGVHKNVDVFRIDNKMEEYGVSGRSGCYLNINASHSEFKDMFLTLNHELEHAIQDKNIREGNIADDYDVDRYSKDAILKEIIGCDYYSDNYASIFSEYDAEFKANIRAACVLGLTDVIEKHSRDLEIIKENALKAVKDARLETNHSGYRESLKRNSLSTLNELFEKKMENLRVDDADSFSDIISRYPIIKYEYHCEVGSTFTRKSIEELVEDLDKASLKKDKGIYYNLLKCRIDHEKEDSDISDNIKVVRELYLGSQYSGTTKKVLNKLLDICIGYESNKYEGYFYKNVHNKR